MESWMERLTLRESTQQSFTTKFYLTYVKCCPYYLTIFSRYVLQLLSRLFDGLVLKRNNRRSDYKQVPIYFNYNPGLCIKENMLSRKEHRLRVFQYRALRRMFGKSEEVAGGWERLYNEELINLNASPNIRVIKWMMMKMVGKIAYMGEMRNAYKILVENLKERDHS